MHDTYLRTYLLTGRINHGKFPDGDFDDRPHIAIWPPKTDTYISKSIKDIIQIQWQTWGFQPQQDQQKCAQLPMSMHQWLTNVICI